MKQQVSQLPFDKKLLILEQLQAEAFQKLLGIIGQETKQKIERPLDAWDILENLAGTVDAPPDWSSEHDHYLYGTPKRNIGNE
ncbi:hypothetical protein C7H19_08875 [Aphanothece hegewaldii CCALA 016]|uniref:DUF2281 domain-containing protein n=1 Tax=Aphanothece hegewaldii CCALA 016 TaxID=2107694 RepID=A0A2T1LZE1_9CHRO|nr:hypothetical protein C7H19_08875 [Aphanothece hegewaldii CCALA 016]